MSSTCSSAAASTPTKAAARARSGSSHKGIGSPGAKRPVIGYSRHKPFEHIYRDHRRYRITEGAEEFQMRKVGAYLFGYLGRGVKRSECTKCTKSRALAEAAENC